MCSPRPPSGSGRREKGFSDTGAPRLSIILRACRHETDGQNIDDSVQFFHAKSDGQWWDNQKPSAAHERISSQRGIGFEESVDLIRSGGKGPSLDRIGPEYGELVQGFRLPDDGE